MTHSLSAKRVLLTGGSSGIGLALARALREYGAMVHVFDRDPPPDGDHQWTQADLRDRDALVAALKTVQGPIDILINNAGVMRRGDLFQTTEEEYDLLFGTHVKASWMMIKEAEALLAKHAVIAQMSSGHALEPPTNPGVYSLTKQSALDLASMVARTRPQWTVKAICPGPIDTPLARYGVKGKALKKKETIMLTPEHLAERIVTLLMSPDNHLLRYDEKTHDHVLETTWPTHVS